eukprot:CAMPEP_0115015362 /NCGR_PEP_ID=MMETSP0216-20121206/26725_1 /TAXON_ID=223996 /ORGANISM="Protocruzia adherens, Strain Boccale" /LENGTH=286 /DNA_ID=CAMNT_0002385471 /DNA_START=370 /DNA_END=1230 /DNA_ORIENTATION=+
MIASKSWNQPVNTSYTISPFPMFKCPMDGCTKEFTREYTLKMHLNVHRNIKRFVCDQCGKKFTVKQYLKEHLLTHTKDKPFACPFPGCTKKYRQRGKLYLHKKKHNMSTTDSKCPQNGAYWDNMSTTDSKCPQNGAYWDNMSTTDSKCPQNGAYWDNMSTTDSKCPQNGAYWDNVCSKDEQQLGQLIKENQIFELSQMDQNNLIHDFIKMKDFARFFEDCNLPYPEKLEKGLDLNLSLQQNQESRLALPAINQCHQGGRIFIKQESDHGLYATARPQSYGYNDRYF